MRTVADGLSGRVISPAWSGLECSRLPDVFSAKGDGVSAVASWDRDAGWVVQLVHDNDSARGVVMCSGAWDLLHLLNGWVYGGAL
jgi:hypothetical protein